MRKNYDFSKARRNPYAKLLKRPVTIRLDATTVDYFKALAEKSEIPYETLINLYQSLSPRLRIQPAPHQSALAKEKVGCRVTAVSLTGSDLAGVRWRIALILAALLLGIAAAKTGECAWCPSGPCLTSSSCVRCTCLIPGGETQGRCYSAAD